jgi:hypothetical protein
MMDRRHRVGLGCASLAGLASLLLACGPRSNPTAAFPAPEVEYNGCWAVSLPGPVCTLWPAPAPKLKLWVRADPAMEVEVHTGGQRLSEAGREVLGGRFFYVTLPPQTSSLTVRLRRRDGSRSAPWSLMLARPDLPEWYSKLRELNQDLISQRLAQVRKAAPRKEQGLVLWMLASLAHAVGHDNEAATYLEQGITVDREEGLLSGEVDKAALLARIHLDHARFADARRILTDLRFPAAAPADAQYLVAYHQGLLADRVGDYRSALEQFQKAIGLAVRGGMNGYRWASEQILARIFQDLGRSQEAAKLFARLDADRHPETDCDVGTFLTNEAWSRLLAREAGEEAGDPTPELQEARDIFDHHDCRPDQRLNARINLALAYQQAHRWPEARRALTAVKAPALASHASLDQRLWQLDLEGRQAIAENSLVDALRSYDELARLAENALSLEGRFRAALGRARARHALGQRKAALADLAEADDLIYEQTWHIPAYEGRDTFVAQRQAANRLYLQLLLEDQQPQRAFELVRRDRSRLLHQLAMRDRLAHLTLDEQRRWEQSLSRYWALRDQIHREAAKEEQLPGDQLRRNRESRASQLEEARKGLDRAMADLGDPGSHEEIRLSPPGPGEVILAYHPLPEGWAGFAAYPEGIKVVTFDLPAGALADPRAPGSFATLARSLIEPFHSVLGHAQRVRVLPYGPLRSVDFHALPLNGKPLLAQLPVVYGLDLPARPSLGPAGRPVALLVANPEGDLPAAGQEAPAVSSAIGTWGQGWTVKRLDGTAAKAGRVREELSGADLFQFSGHGEFAGFAGWDSALRLADGSRLTPGDLLALRRVPAWVVLSTCEGGRSSEQAPGEGIGLAQAFLLAGSRAVVATTRLVPDTTARDFVIELYRGWRPGMDLAQQFQRAQQVCQQRDPAADWASFRLLEP